MSLECNVCNFLKIYKLQGNLKENTINVLVLNTRKKTIPVVKVQLNNPVKCKSFK